jgi:hypothetical protein
MMYSGDPRYDAANFAADAGGGSYARSDSFYTGTQPISFGVGPHTPLGVDPTAYQIDGFFNVLGRSPGEARGIVPTTAPTQDGSGSSSGAAPAATSPAGVAGLSVEQLLIGALVALVAVKIIFD